MERFLSFLGFRPPWDFSNVPDWFPRRSLELSVNRHFDQTLLDSIATRFANCDFISNCSIQRIWQWYDIRRIFGLGGRISVSLNLRGYRVGCFPAFGPIGICGSVKRTNAPLQQLCEVGYFFPSDGRVRLSLVRPLFSFADISASHIFPSVKLSVGFQYRKCLEKRLIIVTTGTVWTSATGGLSLGIQSKNVGWEYSTTGVNVTREWESGVCGERVNLWCKGTALVDAIAVRNSIVPAFRTRVSGRVTLPYRLRVEVESGTSLATQALPRFERFRPGGTPGLRGVGYGGCVARDGAGPAGADQFATVALVWGYPVEFGRNTKGQLFGTAGVAKLSYAAPGEANLKDPRGVIAVGAGITSEICGRVVEINAAVPLWISMGVPFRFLQLGMGIHTKEGIKNH
jgi:hypothetical protein